MPIIKTILDELKNSVRRVYETCPGTEVWGKWARRFFLGINCTKNAIDLAQQSLLEETKAPDEDSVDKSFHSRSFALAAARAWAEGQPEEKVREILNQLDLILGM